MSILLRRRQTSWNIMRKAVSLFLEYSEKRGVATKFAFPQEKVMRLPSYIYPYQPISS